MSKYIIGISVDKVQTFLYEAIHVHAQEKQTEKATLKSIKKSSEEISGSFYHNIQDRFPEFNLETALMACSGVCIFSSSIGEGLLIDRLNGLFLKYYKESQGQKILKYTYFPDKDGQTEIEKIKDAKQSLKAERDFNNIIEKNAEVLFSFHPIIKKQDNLEKQSFQKIYSLYAYDIDELYEVCGQALDSSEEKEEKHFRIAVIKADLDGMGKMFQDIKNYKLYKEISAILNQVVSLDGLHKTAECLSKKEKDKKRWIFPLYVAGDDIYFIVAAEYLLKGVALCRAMLNEAKRKLEKACDELELEDEKVNLPMSMSIGAAITFNKEPIRYYTQMVEEELKNAKKTKSKIKGEIKNLIQTRISIMGLTFLDVDYRQMKEKGLRTDLEKKHYPLWQYFQRDLSLLNYIKSEEKYKENLGTTNFFYTLLENLTQDDIRNSDKKYITFLLYYLMPQHINFDSDRLGNMELLLNSAILRQLYLKYSTKIKRNENRLSLEDKEKYRLETYLRLMILFSDPRFVIQEEKTAVFNSEPQEVDKARKLLLDKSRKYLLDVLDKESGVQFRELFVEWDQYFTYEERNGKKCKSEKPYPCYRHLNIDKAMFFRMKDTEHIKPDKVAKMIALKNPMSKEEVGTANNERKKEGKAPYHLYFDKEEFIKNAEKFWTPDYIDALMLFYQYNELLIQYKGKKRKEKSEGDKGGNKDA